MKWLDIPYTTSLTLNMFISIYYFKYAKFFLICVFGFKHGIQIEFKQQTASLTWKFPQYYMKTTTRYAE